MRIYNRRERVAAQPIVTFTPHLVPMNRGILSTAYCKLKSPMTLPDLRALVSNLLQR